ncbi:hypothetical protein BH18ACT12_BH18ACT12_09290 [soil metagenome]
MGQRVARNRSAGDFPGVLSVHLAEGERHGTAYLILILILILGGVGLWVAKILLWIALILLGLWIISFFMRGGSAV